jgi:hypothetical protein
MANDGHSGKFYLDHISAPSRWMFDATAVLIQRVCSQIEYQTHCTDGAQHQQAIAIMEGHQGYIPASEASGQVIKNPLRYSTGQTKSPDTAGSKHADTDVQGKAHTASYGKWKV